MSKMVSCRGIQSEAPFAAHRPTDLFSTEAKSGVAKMKQSPGSSKAPAKVAEASLPTNSPKQKPSNKCGLNCRTPASRCTCCSPKCIDADLQGEKFPERRTLCSSPLLVFCFLFLPAGMFRRNPFKHLKCRHTAATICDGRPWSLKNTTIDTCKSVCSEHSRRQGFQSQCFKPKHC